jgi:hypothetical protein
MKFQSEEWLNAVKERTNRDTEYQKKTKDLTLKFQNLVVDVPGGIDRMITYEFQRGKVISVTREEKPAPSELRKVPFDGTKWFMRTIAPYDAYVRLNKKEITPLQGIAQGIYKFEGDLMKIQAKTPSLTHFTDLCSTIPCEYE